MSALGSSSGRVTVKINGQSYGGWTTARISRSLLHCASSFELDVTERWAGQEPPQPWQIKPFDAAQVLIGDDVVLTGYVDEYEPSFSAGQHTVRIAGRSKTCDIVDCMPDIKGGEFVGYTLDKIARALATPFGVTVKVECDVGAAFPVVTLEKTETAFSLLSKLARLRSAIVTDNAAGELVLTQTGSAGSAGSIIEGENILSASAKLSGAERFQTYAVYSQTPALPNTKGETQIEADGTDPNVPRPRRHAEMIEDPADLSQTQAFATWRALRNYAAGTEATITVQGFRQADGSLWNINSSVYVDCAFLDIQKQMLIGTVTHEIDDRTGSRTQLLVAPPEAFQPGPDGKKVTGKTAYVWHEGDSMKKGGH